MNVSNPFTHYKISDKKNFILRHVSISFDIIIRKGFNYICFLLLFLFFILIF